MIIHVPGGVEAVIIPIVVRPICVAFMAPKVCLGGPELNLVHSSVLVLVIFVEQGLSFSLTKVLVVHHGAESIKGLIEVGVGVAVDVDLRPKGIETSPSLLVGADHAVELHSLNLAIRVLVIVSEALTDDSRCGVLRDPEEVGLPLGEA